MFASFLYHRLIKLQLIFDNGFISMKVSFPQAHHAILGRPDVDCTCIWGPNCIENG
jgi:hypothetical protein